MLFPRPIPTQGTRERGDREFKKKHQNKSILQKLNAHLVIYFVPSYVFSWNRGGIVEYIFIYPSVYATGILIISLE